MQRKPSVRPRPPVWPAYLVAGACFALAIGTSLSNLTLTAQLRQAQMASQRDGARATSLVRSLSLERTALADLESPSAQHYGAKDAQVVSSNGRLYVLMSALPMPPRGRIYQAWALERGAASMTPSVRFIPDRHGAAVVALDDVDANRTTSVAVSVEPDSGSRAPTSTLILNVTLGD